MKGREDSQPEGAAGEHGFERLSHAMAELRAATGYLGINHAQVCVALIGDANAQRIRDTLPLAWPMGGGSEICELDGIIIQLMGMRRGEEPIPLILTCPACGVRHVDKGDFATKPHHTHACQGCGLPWRPAKVATVGVQFLPGYRDGWAE